MYISVTTDELRTRRLSSAHLEETVKAISEDGYVIMKDVISHEPLDVLKGKMEPRFRNINQIGKVGWCWSLTGASPARAAPFCSLCLF